MGGSWKYGGKSEWRAETLERAVGSSECWMVRGEKEGNRDTLVVTSEVLAVSSTGLALSCLEHGSLRTLLS